ncbi:hypothetical protein DACRYDRAFT_99472 [Dacryopinax primogenitus]|uniref:F-box domain-containing protein n=1 Tax=Dacryopinax primogenitus (strain DJM 731) TaxID=1858805 RepID=M5G4D0_DACPD|nr:uncharacterized protein DACRYDRAFT_99472 [Dacryopinax primogenitus]EJU03085.1 hypothetical protein DACRYDRAFT_99472 [Dacryopinax primogenitus]
MPPTGAPLSLLPPSAALHALTVARRDANVSLEYITSLQSSIQVLEAQIAALALEREGLGAQLSLAQARYAPIGRLPSELLATIFGFAVGTGRASRETLSRVIRVCRHWRRVSLATSFLWTTVLVDADCNWDSIRLHLRMSKGLPLDVLIHFDDFPRSIPRDAIGEALLDAMELLQPIITRTRTFRLYVLTEALAYSALLKVHRMPAPILERLTVRVAEERSDLADIPPLFRPFAGSTPRLSSLSLQSIRFGGALPVTDSLRSFSLGGYSVNEGVPMYLLLSVFRDCRKLESVRLESMADVRERPPNSGSILLPKLSQLVLASCGTNRAQYLLRILILPRLERLELDNLGEITQVLRDFDIKAEHLPLRHIRVEACLFNELRLMHLFMKWSGIETIELIECEDVSDNLLRGLSEPPGAEKWILPQLKYVSLEGCSNIHDTELVRFVSSRVQGRDSHSEVLPSRLQSVDVAKLSLSKVTLAWLANRVTVGFRSS